MALQKQFCFTHIQLSCFQSLDKFYLVKKIRLKDINNQLYFKLENELEKLNILSENKLRYSTNFFTKKH